MKKHIILLASVMFIISLLAVGTFAVSDGQNMNLYHLDFDVDNYNIQYKLQSPSFNSYWDNGDTIIEYDNTDSYFSQDYLYSHTPDIVMENGFALVTFTIHKDKSYPMTQWSYDSINEISFNAILRSSSRQYTLFKTNSDGSIDVPMLKLTNVFNCMNKTIDVMYYTDCRTFCYLFLNEEGSTDIKFFDLLLDDNSGAAVNLTEPRYFYLYFPTYNSAGAVNIGNPLLLDTHELPFIDYLVAQSTSQYSAGYDDGYTSGYNEGKLETEEELNEYYSDYVSPEQNEADKTESYNQGYNRGKLDGYDEGLGDSSATAEQLENTRREGYQEGYADAKEYYDLEYDGYMSPDDIDLYYFGKSYVYENYTLNSKIEEQYFLKTDLSSVATQAGFISPERHEIACSEYYADGYNDGYLNGASYTEQNFVNYVSPTTLKEKYVLKSTLSQTHVTKEQNNADKLAARNEGYSAALSEHGYSDVISSTVGGIFDGVVSSFTTVTQGITLFGVSLQTIFITIVALAVIALCAKLFIFK